MINEKFQTRMASIPTIIRKLRYYREFKLDLKPKIYLQTVDHKYINAAFIQPKCSAHKLEIEIRRKNKVSFYSKFCKLCEKVSVDDVED